MPRKAARPSKTTKAIPPALAHKLARNADRGIEQRSAKVPRGGHSPRPIRHQGR